MYRVIKTTGKAEYEYILITPRGEEINGGDGLHNLTALEIQAQLIMQEVAKRDEAWNVTVDLKDARLQAQREEIESIKQNYRDDMDTLYKILCGGEYAIEKAQAFIKDVLQTLDKKEG